MDGLNIAYAPRSIETNLYCARMIEALTRFGTVRGASIGRLSELLRPTGIQRFDHVFLNWVENGLVGTDGRVGFYRFLKIAAKISLLKLFVRNVIFVRHNHCPHGVAEADRARAKRHTDRLERLCHVAIVHSEREVRPGRLYVPHPLYRSVATADSCEPEDYFILFGRLSRYKRIDSVLAGFPRNRRLLIAGACDDAAYLAELKALAGPNVTFRGEYLSESEAQALVMASQGLIIGHSESDMIVSASFFYAMSLGVRVFCLSSPFLAWAGEALGPDVVRVAPTLTELSGSLAEAEPRQPLEDKSLQRIEALFGDDAVHHALARVIGGKGA